jgi:hypothetical protein
MPSEHAPQQQRLPLGGQRSTTTVHSDSPSTSPAQHSKHKAPKHVVGGRAHTRVPSNKSVQKLAKLGNEGGSHSDLKKLPKNSSTTSLKKNSSHVSLKRNRSSAEIHKRPKSSHGQVKRPASVHFEIGDQDDAWEEASSSASPALSRSASNPSAKPSANNSQAQSPAHSPTLTSRFPYADGSNDRSGGRHTADGKIITEKLLQRTPSRNTTKMSLATATPMGLSPPDSISKPSTPHSATLTDTPRIDSKEEIVSRFVGGSGTPSEHPPFLAHQHHRTQSHSDLKPSDEVKRASSMGNLTRHDSTTTETSDTESALAPRSRKSSTPSAYIPPQQSRTQQKLWLQRASSNIEPQQLAPGAAHGSLVGAGYDGRDPRVKIQLERTGLEYLVVRRHQDPVGKALRRLENLPGVGRRIDGKGRRGEAGKSGLGLSQSLKELRRGRDRAVTPGSGSGGARSSFEEGGVDGSAEAEGEEGVGALLRSVWEKSFELSASAD